MVTYRNEIVRPSQPKRHVDSVAVLGCHALDALHELVRGRVQVRPRQLLHDCLRLLRLLLYAEGRIRDDVVPSRTGMTHRTRTGTVCEALAGLVAVRFAVAVIELDEALFTPIEFCGWGQYGTLVILLNIKLLTTTRMGIVRGRRPTAAATWSSPGYSRAPVTEFPVTVSVSVARSTGRGYSVTMTQPSLSNTPAS